MATGATGVTRRRGGARPGAFVENGWKCRLVKSSGHSINSIIHRADSAMRPHAGPYVAHEGPCVATGATGVIMISTVGCPDWTVRSACSSPATFPKDSPNDERLGPTAEKA